MLDFQAAFQRRGLAGTTSAPSNAEDVPPGAPAYVSGPLANPPQPSATPVPKSLETDSPPGAPAYVNGPLANPPRPSPTPPTQSLQSLANGGTNHAEAWMQGNSAPVRVQEQQPFSPNSESKSKPQSDYAPFTWSQGY